MGDMMQAFILLLAGFLVVFTVLVLLIVIVTLYSKIIRLTQDAGKKRSRSILPGRSVMTSPAHWMRSGLNMGFTQPVRDLCRKRSSRSWKGKIL